MAGLKETPRQKMIGMMYLVLTALLALQVSDALLQKFVLLNNSLEGSNAASSKQNSGIEKGIIARVAELPNQAAYADVIKSAAEVRKISDQMVSDIDDLKNKITNGPGEGIDPETNNLRNIKETEKIYEMMIGQGKKGLAYQLEPKLETFVAKMTTYADKGTVFEKLTHNGAEDPLGKKDATLRKKDFAEFNFSETPVPAALATLSQKQSEVRRYEAEVLGQLAAKVGAKEIKFDKVFAQVAANANTVVAGMDYEAEVFIAATSSGFSPRMSFNGSSIATKDGRGQIKFKTSGGAYDKNGLCKKTYVASVSYQGPEGAKTESITKEYFVLKPSYNIETATLPAMYLGCANRISVVSPGLGSLWNPSFSSEGGEAIQGERGKVTVVPNRTKVILKISNGGSLLGAETFNVRSVPKPEITLLGNGGILDEKRGSSATGLRSISANATADESFKATNPEDANYRVSELTVALARGTRKIGSVNGSGSVNVSSLAAQAQPGDRYYIEINGVQRRNFKGSVESIPISKKFNIPLN